MSARPLPCRREGCGGVLGETRGPLLVVAAGVELRCLLARCALVCPVCGTAREWRGRELRVPARRDAVA